jgi:hypothetical protein
MLKRKPALKLVPKVDQEFAALIAPLSSDEYQQLEANLIAHGCRDALVVWRGLLLDGHNRLQICNRHGIAYEHDGNRVAGSRSGEIVGRGKSNRQTQFEHRSKGGSRIPDHAASGGDFKKTPCGQSRGVSKFEPELGGTCEPPSCNHAQTARTDGERAPYLHPKNP